LWYGSRDSARTPVQWDDGEHAGFTIGTPWFYVNDNYKEVNVASQEADADSVLNFYRAAIKLRKELSCVRYGTYKEYNKYSSKVYVYTREDEKQKILVVCSYAKTPVRFKAPKNFDISEAKLVLNNYETVQENMLQPYEARVYLLSV
jgi:oligo-1,6-glucosidase